MELTSVLRAVRRHWALVALSFSVVLGLGLAAAYVPVNRYKATAVVLVEPDPAKAPVQLQVIDVIVPSLIARADSRSFADLAKARVGEDVSNASVKVDTVDNGSGVLAITASSTRQGAVAPWATAYAEELVSSGTGEGYVTLTVLDTARAPAQPYAPARRPVVISAVLLGMIAAVLTAIAAAAYRRRVDEIDEIRSRLGITILGEIPKLRSLDHKGIDVLLGPEAPPEITEALQTLRTNVEFLLGEQRPRTVAVVSASSGEGKSTITAALAWALASVGEPVVAIDADLRRPTLHRLLWGRPGPGLSSAGEILPERLLQATRLPTLRLLSAGVPSRHPAEVLRANLPGVVAALGDSTVVIDCPPLDGFAETGSIVALTQSVILVIDRGRRDIVDVERSIVSLQERGANVLGLVINRSTRKAAAGSYYYEAARAEAPRRRQPKPPLTNGSLEGDAATAPSKVPGHLPES